MLVKNKIYLHQYIMIIRPYYLVFFLVGMDGEVGNDKGEVAEADESMCVGMNREDGAVEDKKGGEF